MKEKRPFSGGEKLLLLAMALCIAVACAMAARFYRVTRENGEAERTQNRIEQAALQTVEPTARITPGETRGGQERAEERRIEEKETKEAEEVKEVKEETKEEAGKETKEEIEGEIEEESVEEEDPALLAILYEEQQAKLNASPVPTETPAPTEAPVPTATLAPTTTPVPMATSAPTATPAPTERPLYATLRPTAAPTPEPTATPSPKPTEAPTAEPPKIGTVTERALRYSVDFDSLRAVNEDVIGWMIQEGTEINFPIVQGEDNEYYLTHLYTGAVNRTGSIFADAGNSPYFTDMCTYLYGHNRKNGSMFASLPNYLDEEYYRAHPTMTVITPYEDYAAEIFACVRESAEQEETWRVKQFSGRGEYETFVQSILDRSRLDTGIVPRWGDPLLALCTCTNEVHEERYIVFARLRPIVYAGGESVSVMKMEMDALEGTSRTVNVPGRGEMQYYAQNDPVWAAMRYEARKSKQARPFGQGGCGPTSMAMAIANLVPEESLGGISAYARVENGYTFCTCSVNQYFCNHRHAQYKLETPAEFRRYLPLAIASFATGNNIWGETSRGDGGGTNTAFMKRVTEAYGLYFTLTKDRELALSALADGAMVIASTGGKASPFTGGGHYLTLASVYEGSLYILDPYLKADYGKTDRRHLITQIEPGVLRVSMEDLDELLLYTFYIVDRKPH